MSAHHSEVSSESNRGDNHVVFHINCRGIVCRPCLQQPSVPAGCRRRRGLEGRATHPSSLSDPWLPLGTPDWPPSFREMRGRVCFVELVFWSVRGGGMRDPCAAWRCSQPHGELGLSRRGEIRVDLQHAGLIYSSLNLSVGTIGTFPGAAKCPDFCLSPLHRIWDSKRNIAGQARTTKVGRYHDAPSHVCCCRIAQCITVQPFVPRPISLRPPGTRRRVLFPDPRATVGTTATHQDVPMSVFCHAGSYPFE